MSRQRKGKGWLGTESVFGLCGLRWTPGCGARGPHLHCLSCSRHPTPHTRRRLYHPGCTVACRGGRSHGIRAGPQLVSDEACFASAAGLGCCCWWSCSPRDCLHWSVPHDSYWSHTTSCRLLLLKTALSSLASGCLFALPGGPPLRRSSDVSSIAVGAEDSSGSGLGRTTLGDAGATLCDVEGKDTCHSRLTSPHGG